MSDSLDNMGSLKKRLWTLPLLSWILLLCVKQEDGGSVQLTHCHSLPAEFAKHTSVLAN